MHTYLQIDTACVQHINMGHVQAHSNNSQIEGSWNLWDLKGQRAQGCSILSIAKTPLRALRPSKYCWLHWLTNLSYLKYGNSKSQPQTTKRQWILPTCSLIGRSNCVTSTATMSNQLLLTGWFDFSSSQIPCLLSYSTHTHFTSFTAPHSNLPKTKMQWGAGKIVSAHADSRISDCNRSTPKFLLRA